MLAVSIFHYGQYEAESFGDSNVERTLPRPDKILNSEQYHFSSSVYVRVFYSRYLY